MKTNKKTLYGAIVYCLIIGVIYVILSVLALITRKCSFNTEKSSFIYMLYLMYFRGHECAGSIKWEVFQDNNGANIIHDYNESYETITAAQRTYMFAISYLSLHIALIATSLIAFFGIALSYISRKSFVIFVVPLVVVLIATIVCDGLATVYYIIDTASVTKLDGLIDLLQLINNGNNDEEDGQKVSFILDNISFFTRIGPPIVMALATSKLFILWVCNAFWCVAIVRHGWSLATENDEEALKNYQNAIMANDNPAFEDENSHKANTHNPLSRAVEVHRPSMTSDMSLSPKLNNHPQQTVAIPEQTVAVPEQTVAAVAIEQTEQRYYDTSRSTDYVFPHQIYAKSSKQKQQQPVVVEANDELNFKIQRPTLEIPVQKSRTSSTDKCSSPPPSYHDHEIENRMSRFQESNGRAITAAFAYENVPKNRENQYASIVVQQKEIKPPRPIPPPKPTTSSKYYLQNTGHEEPIQYRADSRLSNPKVDRSSSGLKAPQELRSQLPWSYFKSGDNAPRRTLVHEEFPEMPMPDYSSPARKRREREYNGADFDETWSYQRY